MRGVFLFIYFQIYREFSPSFTYVCMYVCVKSVVIRRGRQNKKWLFVVTPFHTLTHICVCVCVYV